METGSFIFADKSTYVGEYLRSEPPLTDVDGEGVLSGVIIRNGEGVFKTEGGLSYTGGWKHNKMSGVGVLVQPTGCSYKGDFTGNMFEGRGTYTWADGSSFTGKWAKNRPFDDGTYVNAAGIAWVGGFEKIGAMAIKPEVF